MQGVSEIAAPVKLARAFDLKRACAASIAALAWSALAVQVYFDIADAIAKNQSIANGLIQFFSFFTIQTNMLIALLLTISFARPQAEQFLTRPSVKSALANYIVIVGVVYALMLRHLWDPHGMQLVADRVLHDAIPALYPLYWLAFHPKGRLRWIDPIVWLIYPVVYFAYILLRGAAFGVYPYPFVDVIKLGYGGVAFNALLFLAAFFCLGLIFAAVDRALAERDCALPTGLAERPNSDK
jgi:hypothetical protein